MQLVRVTFLAGLLGILSAACATAGKDQPNPQNDAPATPGDAPDEPDAQVLPPDANGCATQPCDILTQCGCGSSMACDIDSSDNMGTACRAVLTAGIETSTCTNASRCAPGYVCLFEVGTNVGTCNKYCDANADCGTPRGKCIISINAGGQPIAGIPKACTSNCDPLGNAANDCPAGYKCSLFSSQNDGDFVDCVVVATAGTQGAACLTNGNPNDKLCAANHLCTTVNSATACRKMCNRTNNTGCVGAQTCLGFNPAFSVGGVEYGVCN